MVRTSIFDFQVMTKSLGSDKPCLIPAWAKMLMPPEKLFAAQRACRFCWSWCSMQVFNVIVFQMPGKMYTSGLQTHFEGDVVGFLEIFCLNFNLMLDVHFLGATL